MALSALTIDMRELWKQVRLDAIRRAVQDVIEQLEGSDGSPRPDAAAPTLDVHPTVGPRRAALQACCDELRAGCGMPPLHAHPARPTAVLRDLEWEAHNATALEGYRSQARVALREALGLAPNGPT